MNKTVLILFMILGITLIGCTQYNTSGWEYNGSTIKSLNNTPIGVLGDLDVGGNFTGNQIYGRMSAHNDSGDAFPFPSGDTYYNFTFSKSFTNGFIFNDAGDYLEAKEDGSYFVSYHASGSGDANSIYKLGVAVNSEVKNCSTSFFRTSNANDVVNMAGSMIIGEVSGGDRITLMIKDITGAGNGKRYSSQLSIIRVGDKG